MLICIYEDRPAALIGVKLLVLSLRRQCRDAHVFVSCPLPDARFADWAGRQPNLKLHQDPSMAGQGWNTKPSLLLQLLDAGHPEVIWIDSDVIVARDFRYLLAGRGSEEIVVGQEQYWGFYQGGTIRTRHWGLEPGRSLPWTINSGFVRVTPSHRELLLTWRSLLEDSDYRRAQQQEPMHERPIHLQGDQDVLTALLASRRFSHLPVVYLRRGRDIVQGIGPAGYAINERLKNMGRALPPLIHGVYPKPWALARQNGWSGWAKRYYDRVSLELSPYATVARSFMQELDESIPQMEVRTVVGRLCRALAWRDATMQGLPLAMFHSAGKRLKRIMGSKPRRDFEAIAERVTDQRANGSGMSGRSPLRITKRSVGVSRKVTRFALLAADRLERFVDRVTIGGRIPKLPADPQDVHKVLLWSMDRLGDVVRATPAIRALKAHFSSAEITMVAAGRAGPILRENPDISQLFQIDSPSSLRNHYHILRKLKNSTWDLGILLEVDPDWARVGTMWFRRLGVQRWVRFDFGDGVERRAAGVSITEQGSWIDQLNRLVTAAGAEPPSSDTRVYLSQEERAWATQFLQACDIQAADPFFLIHPGGNFLTVSRQWPPQAFAQLITLMRQRWPYPIVVTGVKQEHGVIAEVQQNTSVPLVDLCGRLNLRQLAAVIERSTTCIMNDTGPLHVAHALGKKTVVILGPTAPEVVAVPAHGRVVRAELPCSPCAFLSGWKACSNPIQWECLTQVSPTQVLKAVADQMGHTPPRPKRLSAAADDETP